MEVFWPPLVVRHINTRLDRDTVAAFEGLSPAVSRAVMDVETDIVADVVGEKLVDIAHGHIEPDAPELIDETACSDAVNILE